MFNPTTLEEAERPLTIGQLAAQTEVPVDTLRYYEREGLLPKATRNPSSGYRQFGPEALDRVRFIRRAQGVGFSLREIAELLTLQDDPNQPAEKVRAIAQARLTTIEEKMAQLEHMRQALQTLADSCPGEGSTQMCPILRGLTQP